MEERLRARLREAIPQTAIDWGMSAQGASTPRIVLSVVSGGQTVTQDGPVGLRARRVQADCYAPTYGAAKALARRAIACLGGWTDGPVAGCFLDAERDIDPDRGAGETLFRVSLDFMIHAEED